MARKATANHAPHRGLSDVIGIVLMAAGLLLMVAQLSFDPNDVASNRFPPNETVHNWIGSYGAGVSNIFFFLFGAGAFVLPLILIIFGLGYLFEFFAYLKRRWFWALLLFVSCLGLLGTYSGRLGNVTKNLNSGSAGGLVGQFMNDTVFGHFGTVGATIIFVTLYLISLIFLTNFQFGDWVRGLLHREPPMPAGLTPEEKALEKRRRELEKKALKLQEQMDKAAAKTAAKAESASSIGADMQPVPEPTVRDLSVPLLRPGKTNSKPAKTAAKDDEVVEEGEVISAREIEAATAADVLGKANTKTDAKADPAAALSAAPAGKPKVLQAKPKPIKVASTPMIGNYQLPAMGLLHHPDPNVKPTETREELVANARLMQQHTRPVPNSGGARRYHQRPHDHPLRAASGAGREAGKNHRPHQQHCRRPQGGTH